MFSCMFIGFFNACFNQFPDPEGGTQLCKIPHNTGLLGVSKAKFCLRSLPPKFGQRGPRFIFLHHKTFPHWVLITSFSQHVQSVSCIFHWFLPYFLMCLRPFFYIYSHAFFGCRVIPHHPEFRFFSPISTFF